jgi:hypothetical protein
VRCKPDLSKGNFDIVVTPVANDVNPEKTLSKVFGRAVCLQECGDHFLDAEGHTPKRLCPFPSRLNAQRAARAVGSKKLVRLLLK